MVLFSKAANAFIPGFSSGGVGLFIGSAGAIGRVARVDSTSFDFFVGYPRPRDGICTESSFLVATGFFYFLCPACFFTQFYTSFMACSRVHVDGSGGGYVECYSVAGRVCGVVGDAATFVRLLVRRVAGTPGPQANSRDTALVYMGSIRSGAEHHHLRGLLSNHHSNSILG